MYITIANPIIPTIILVGLAVQNALTLLATIAVQIILFLIVALIVQIELFPIVALVAQIVLSPLILFHPQQLSFLPTTIIKLLQQYSSTVFSLLILPLVLLLSPLQLLQPSLLHLPYYLFTSLQLLKLSLPLRLSTIPPIQHLPLPYFHKLPTPSIL